MRVISPKNEYTVLTRIRDGRHFTALDREGRTCRLVIAKRPHEAARLAPILLKWLQIEEFSDFYEFFPYQDGIAAVFAHRPDGIALDRAVADMPYSQRAVALRSTFALILSQNLPPEILSGVIHPENLRLSPSGRVALTYDLPRGGTGALTSTVKHLCGDCSAPEIDALCARIKDAASSDSAELYRLAGPAADKLMGYSPPPEREKPTISAIKNRVAAAKLAVLGRAPLLLAVAAILAGYAVVGFLFYRNVIAPPRVDNGISAIGTVVIDDGA